MKVTDLKTGDWIDADGKNNIGRIVDVSSSNFDVVVHRIINRHHYFPTKAIADIKPIPLTANILTANGFRKQWDYIFTIPANKPNELWLWDKDGEWEVTYNNNDLLTTIRFVHELQHLLWALGLDDNLKIE